MYNALKTTFFLLGVSALDALADLNVAETFIATF